MSNLEKSAEDWVREGIVDSQTAAAIIKYEQSKKIPTGNLTLVVFAILGAVLVALGISLMVAENWDSIPKLWKTTIAFCPMLIGQILVLLSTYKFKESLAWKEASSAFLFLSVGATIALLSQIFQLQGTITEFLLLWMILVTPILFLTKSKTTNLLYILFATWYVSQTYWGDHQSPLHYLWFLAAMLSFTFWQIIGKPNQRAFGMIAGWLIPISIAISLGVFMMSAAVWVMLGYMGMFQIFILVNNSELWPEPRNWKNGLGILGLCGVLVLLFLNSYEWVLSEIVQTLRWSDLMQKPWAIITLVIIFASYLFLATKSFTKKVEPLNFLLPLFIILIMLAKISSNPALVIILFNAVILIIAIGFIVKGIASKNLLWLNVGLLVFSLLVVLRFFDFHLSFFVRGLAFLILGLGFFLANRFVITEKKEDLS